MLCALSPLAPVCRTQPCPPPGRDLAGGRDAGDRAYGGAALPVHGRVPTRQETLAPGQGTTAHGASLRLATAVSLARGRRRVASRPAVAALCAAAATKHGAHKRR